MSQIGLPPGMKPDDAYIAGMADGEELAMKQVLAIIDQHIPSIRDEDEAKLDELRYNSDVDRFGQPAVDVAELARRTCHCGLLIDGFYEYVEHLKDVLRKEST